MGSACRVFVLLVLRAQRLHECNLDQRCRHRKHAAHGKKILKMVEDSVCVTWYGMARCMVIPKQLDLGCGMAWDGTGWSKVSMVRKGSLLTGHAASARSKGASVLKKLDGIYILKLHHNSLVFKHKASHTKQAPPHPNKERPEKQWEAIKMLQNSIICMYVVICQHHKNQLRPVEFFLFSHQSLHFLLKSINFDGFGNLFFGGGVAVTP